MNKVMISQQTECRPFVKWVGGQSQLLPELLERVPDSISRYYEPFLGGGALFFALQPKNSILSDINPELINLYTVVRDKCEALIKDLRRHVHTSEYFYDLRGVDRLPEYRSWSAVRRASRLIFLNKTCFNGLFRVNSKGHFNTPFGSYVNPKIIDAENLRACSAALENADLKVASFTEVLSKIGPRDFVYFDPPYVPLSDTAYFTSYSTDGFSMENQEELYEICCKLDRKGVKFMLSNSSAPWILERYRDFNLDLVGAKRAINSKGDRRGTVNEVIVTNY